MATRKKSAKKLYCLRIELDQIKPLIWRRFWIEGDTTLSKLHHSIQAIMGWTDAHLHQFQIGGAAYAIPDPEADDPARPVVDERFVTMDRVAKGISSFGYMYDFGDGWQHTITIEQVKPLPEHPRGCAFVEAGERACPPEDAGGSHSYQEFLDDLAANPKRTEVRQFLRWAGTDFDPSRFDRHAANAALLRMAWNQWSDDLPAITGLIEADGDITIGRLGEIPCVATAADSDQCLAMLVQRDGESVPQLLLRLNAAIAAFDENGPIDEVNPPPLSTKPRRRSPSRR
jgi:hypothetical protein